MVGVAAGRLHQLQADPFAVDDQWPGERGQAMSGSDGREGVQVREGEEA